MLESAWAGATTTTWIKNELVTGSSTSQINSPEHVHLDDTNLTRLAKGRPWRPNFEEQGRCAATVNQPEG